MQKRFTDLEIQATIVPTALRWPDPSTSVAWAKLHDGMEGLRGLVRVVDDNCAGIEGNQDFSGDGIARKCADLGVKALSEVAKNHALALAEKAVASDIATLTKHIAQFPAPPTSMAEVMLAQEIRAHAARHSSPVDFALTAIGDPRVLGALLHAPACLSGLTDDQQRVIHRRAQETLDPERTASQQKLASALADLQRGVGATKRMLLQRCELVEDGEGQFRSSREPLPARAPAGPKAAAA